MLNSEKIAQTVLRAWFNDPTGFKDMQKQSNKAAVKAVENFLKSRRMARE